MNLHLSINRKLILLILGSSSAIVLIPLLGSISSLVLVNTIILSYYMFFRPKFLLHPNTLIFAYYFLFFTLPTTISSLYSVFDIEKQLTESEFSWIIFNTKTLYEIAVSYIILYSSFHIFIGKENCINLNVFFVKKAWVYFFYVTSFLLLVYYIQITGGIYNWLLNYKESFLLGREGVGLINFFILFYINLTVFILGIYFKKARNFKLSILIFSLALIIFSAYFQGLKSRVIILLFIFFFPYIINSEVKFRKSLPYAFGLFLILFIGNYIRSNGYYNSFSIFIEYTTHYLNAFQLHDLIVSSSNPDIGKTITYFLNKPLIFLGLINENTPYDLSIQLTQKYFPNDWETMRATQQWPLLTDLHYNFYGLLLGWIPLVLYAYIISILYNKTKNGNIYIGLIFVLEFFRIFSTLRGALIPWQIYIYLFSYITSYYLLKKIIKEKK